MVDMHRALVLQLNKVNLVLEVMDKVTMITPRNTVSRLVVATQATTVAPSTSRPQVNTKIQQVLGNVVLVAILRETMLMAHASPNLRSAAATLPRLVLMQVDLSKHATSLNRAISQVRVRLRVVKQEVTSMADNSHTTRALTTSST